MDLLQNQAQNLVKNGKFVEAAAKYREAMEVCGDGKVAKEFIIKEADCFTLMKNYAKVIDLYDEILSIDGENEDAKSFKAIVFNKIANNLYEECKYMEAKDKYLEASEVCSASDPYNKNYLVNAGLCYETMDKHSEAYEMYDKALKIDSEFIDATNCKANILNIRGQILYDEEKYSEALKTFQDIADLCVDSDSKKNLLVKLGICLLEMKEYDRAVEEFDKALNIDNELKNAKKLKYAALSAHGEHFFKNEKYLEASKKYEESIESCIDSYEKKNCFTNVAICYGKLKKFSNAIEMCDKSLSIDEKFETARNMKATALFEQGKSLYGENKFPEAAKKFEDAIGFSTEIDDKKIFFAHLGNSFSRMSKFSESIEAFDRALEIDPQSEVTRNWKSKTLFNQGISLFDQNKCSEAATKYEEALELCNETEDRIKQILTNLANCYGKLGDYSKSIEILDKVLSIDNELVEAKNNKAIFLNDQGVIFIGEKRFLGAEKNFKMALELCVDSDLKSSIFKNFSIFNKR